MPAWIAVDWGTSRFRAFAVSETGQTIARVSSDKGMSGLAPEDFEAVLLSEIAPWLTRAPMRVLACGMVGSRQGWTEVPYAKVGTDLATLAPLSVPTADPRLDLHIVPGLSQEAPPDVMRGEEMQIAGFLAAQSSFTGWLCLPGTHSKWCRVEDGRLIAFQTLIVGEMFDLFCKHSLLRHSVGDGWEEAVFRTSVADVLIEGKDPLALLFAIRAEGLLQGLSASAARARLSGLLIGAELRAAQVMSDEGAVALVGAPITELCIKQLLRLSGGAHSFLTERKRWSKD